MPDETTSPDDLIAELQAAAEETNPLEGAAFAEDARIELAAYRGMQAVVQRSGMSPEGGHLDERPPEIVVPERYRSRAEVFIVFETFVRSFIDPILVATEIPKLLAEADPEHKIARLAFRRFGEEGPEATHIPALHVFDEDSAALTAIAEQLGHALFGATFRAEDFWATSE